MPVYDLQYIDNLAGLPRGLQPQLGKDVEPGPLGDLFDQVRLCWLAGDWQTIAALDMQRLARHPDREKLSALVASALLQQGKIEQARSLAELARSWGCSIMFLSQTLAASAARNLAHAHMLAGRRQKANRVLAAGFGDTGLTKQLASILLGNSATMPGAADAAPIQSPVSFLHALSASRPRPRARHLPDTRARILNTKGEQLYQTGQYQLAAEYFQRAVNLQPRDAWFCQNLAEAVARLDVACAKQWECTELGDAIAAAGKWEIAVRYYRMALGISSSTVEAHRQAQTFKVEAPREGHLNRPVFIAGCGHSGTSVMLAILGCHPKLHAIPKETALFLRTDQAMQEAMREFDATTRKASKESWVEKTPPHVFQIHRFLAIRPGSRFIIMLRDGRDVVCSLKHREGYLPVKDRVERWIYDNMAADSYREHPQVTFVKYEDLVTETESTLRRICDFLDVEFSESMLRFHETPRRWYSDYIAKPAAITSAPEHKANRNWQINQPLFDGRGRWRQAMSTEEKEYFKASPAQDLLVQLGYAGDAKW